MGKTLLSLIMLILTMTGCGIESSMPESMPSTNPSTEENISQEKELTLFVNNTPLTVKWEHNESVAALFQLAGQEQLTIDMEQYGGFEQVGTLPQGITRNDEQMVTEPGDIVLYSGNSLVIFYGSNTWAYTKLGHIEGLSVEELENILNNKQVTVRLSVVKSEQ